MDLPRPLGGGVALPRPRRRAGIPSADLGALRRAARRTLAVRVALCLGLLAVLVGAVVASRGLEVRQGGFLPVGSTGVLVLDLSTSVDINASRRIHSVLKGLTTSDEPVGLVLFSDTAYEAIPPGTRGIELRPMLRYFDVGGLTRAQLEDLRESAVQRRTPWVGAFRGGTRISAGLRAARAALRRDGIENGSVLLVSDLDYSPFDLTRLTKTMITYREEQLPLRIVPLFPSNADRQFFSRLLGRHALINWNELSRRSGVDAKSAVTGTSPWPLVLAPLLLAGLLAVNELACGRLSVPRLRRPRAEGEA